MKSSLLPLSLVLSCATLEPLPHHPLEDQLLRSRPGYEGKLTNKTCSRFEENKCVDWSVLTYDLSDANFRETANKLEFICKIGGHRYKICRDKPGFCRHEYEQSCFLFICGERKLKKEEYLPASNHQFLLDGDTKCASRGQYDVSDYE